MINKIKLTDVRFWNFALLIALAPLSKYPYIALPAFNFSSFRFGLYQILIISFLALCAKPALLSIKKYWQQSKLATISLFTLSAILIIGLTSAIQIGRSALLVASIGLLIAGVFGAWWYAANELTNPKFFKLIALLMIFAIGYGILAIAQFLFSSLTNETLGILCTNCSSAVFGFPRINGLSAEPQFFANALLPFIFVSLTVFYKHKTRLSLAALILTTIAIGLTFSRGAYFALFAGLVIYGILIYVTKQSLKPYLLGLLVIIVAGVASLAMLVGSASYKYSSTPNITYNTIKSTLEHLSLGVINLPEKQLIVVSTPNTTAVTVISNQESFESPGLIEASTNERLTAANLAIDAWQYSAKNILMGTGAGNLGPFVVAYINSGAPNNLTVYIHYILVLSELGILGLLSFVGLIISSLIALAKNFKLKNNVIFIAFFSTICAFSAQYLFFGSYINVVYIWIWLGFAIGISYSQIAKNKL